MPWKRRRSKPIKLKLQLEAIQNDYAADRKSIIEPSTKWRFDTKKGLESIARSSYQQLQTAWNGHLAEMRPATDSGLLRLLSRSTAFQAQSRRIAELVAEFDRLSNRLPSSTEELERPAKLAEELQYLIRELPDDIPGPVRQLFQSINEGNATAAQLNGGRDAVAARQRHALRFESVLEVRLRWKLPRN